MRAAIEIDGQRPSATHGRLVRVAIALAAVVDATRSPITGASGSVQMVPHAGHR